MRAARLGTPWRSWARAVRPPLDVHGCVAHRWHGVASGAGRAPNGRCPPVMEPLFLSRSGLERTRASRRLPPLRTFTTGRSSAGVSETRADAEEPVLSR